MRIRTIAVIILTVTAALLAVTGRADVPAPPANQNIGFLDADITALTEADCRVCHFSGVPDRHHLLYGEPIPIWTRVPYPDGDGDGVDDIYYGCLNCHDSNMTVVRDCLACHTSGSHHFEPEAQAGLCTFCHGDLVDNPDDGHYVPDYAPSLVTPRRSLGDGTPANSRGNGAGACNYCHDIDALAPPVILDSQSTHHALWPNDNSKCDWCHDFSLPLSYQIRVCERCHGPDSLHNIQTDSPDPDNIGTIVVGAETAGYGHVGRDAGPGDSDCWGCHGFDTVLNSTDLVSGPIVPTIESADRIAFTAGADTAVTLAGESFINIAGSSVYTAHATLTGPDGNPVALVPDLVERGTMTVTIPAGTPAGSYRLRVVKDDGKGDQVASNPVALSIRPRVLITDARGGSVVTIRGSGFGGHGAASLTGVTGSLATPGRGRGRAMAEQEAVIVSWTDTAIVADFGVGVRPRHITVTSVFGSATAEVVHSPRASSRSQGR